MKLAFIVDPLSTLNPGHDTTVALMEAAQLLGHEVFVSSIEDLTVLASKAWTKLQSVVIAPVIESEGAWVSSERDWYHLSANELRCLEEMDAVFMRIDPPVTLQYLYATYILELIDRNHTLVVNSPQGLREANEKMYALQFSSIMPETIVSADKHVIREFVGQYNAAVLKPLGGKAGEGILFLESSDRNFNSLVEISTKQGQEPVMVQRYLEEAQAGDKRIILFKGQALGAVNRVPTGQEFRGNMAVGGRVEKTEITAREAEICQLIAPKLLQDGLYLVGIDVIGGYLTEINVTSPTGIREIDLLNKTTLGKQIISNLVQ